MLGNNIKSSRPPPAAGGSIAANDQQSRMQESLTAILNKQTSQTATRQAGQEALAAFSTPDKIRNEQIKLNALGITGKNNQPLPENGVLDTNTLIAWDKLHHGSGLFGNSNSAIMRALEEEEDGVAKTADIIKGVVPSTTVISPLRRGITLFNDEDKGTSMLRYAKGSRLLMLDRPHSVNGKPIGHHINTMGNKEFKKNKLSSVQKNKLKKLNHTEIPVPVYKAFRDFKKVADNTKKGGKALGAIGLALDAYDLGRTVYYDLNDEDQRLGRDTVEAAVGIGSSWAGGLAGAKLVAMGGAALGTLICPGLGTLIGGFIGGVVGGIAGASGGRKLGQWAVDSAYGGK